MSTEGTEDEKKLVVLLGLVLDDLHDEMLLEMVDDYKGQEATSINNGGSDVQIAYLLEYMEREAREQKTNNLEARAQRAFEAYNGTYESSIVGWDQLNGREQNGWKAAVQAIVGDLA